MPKFYPENTSLKGSTGAGFAEPWGERRFFARGNPQFLGRITIIWDNQHCPKSRKKCTPVKRTQSYCGTNSNLSPSNSPRSLNFKWGITNKAMKDKVINGEASVEPASLAALSINEYCCATW